MVCVVSTVAAGRTLVRLCGKSGCYDDEGLVENDAIEVCNLMEKRQKITQCSEKENKQLTHEFKSLKLKQVLFQSHNKDLEADKISQNNLEINVEQRAKPGMAHEEIQRLTDELQVKEKEQNKLDSTLQVAQLEVEKFKENVMKLKENDSADLQKAKGHNLRLNEEILALRNRVRSLDSEKKMLGKEVEKLKGEINKFQENEQVRNHSL
ncbi:PREDICTED: coiled-coil domain-containing protein 30 [Elephantulus edwardii]|uniref:coiled-coil domain-containing protein 30 n=1 Tax=Elephantulus edwardii TaxID=28737 RepID=UPI0003F07C3B|nr:PREDICTED: coiled-coil domain-containing protein 30 [Elephantulus edwardii]